MEFLYQSKYITWENVLPENALEFDAAFKILPTKGKIAWEYNPLRNLRLDLDMFEYKGKLHSKEDYELDYKEWIINNPESEKLPNGVALYLRGELVDFITNQLSFDINHPVTLTPSYSYDGSVDLILNDGKNQPRLINTRFSTTGMNTYEVVNRKGDNDTNIYDMGDLFDIDTSLYKKTNKIPLVIYNGTQSGGDLKIGNYHFYFKYSDADGNETDFIAESGLVSIFKGYSTPMSMSTGQRDENSLKCINFTIKNIDSGYQYLHVYYTRATAENNQNMIVKAEKINLEYLVNTKGVCYINITGSEDTTEIPLSDINLQYNVILSAKSLAICQNMLFMANVQKANIPYEELQDLSLRFLPYLKTKKYPAVVDETYSIKTNSKGYFDSKFIYEYTGYWDKDLYRLGIVYILKDGTLSPVFNIRGREKVKEFLSYDHAEGLEVTSRAYTNIPVFSDPLKKHRSYINYDEASNLVIKSGESLEDKDIGNGFFENVKGVVSLDSTIDTNTILGFDIRADLDTISELKKYVRGFFFVRQKRLPMTLCQGITIGIENTSNLPAIPTTHGITNIDYTNTYVETRDINPDEIHYIMEGFMGRFTYKLKKKSSGFWGKLGTALAIVAIAAVGVAGAVFTGGALGVAAGGTIASVISAGATAVTGALIPIAIGAASVVGGTTLIALGQEIALTLQSARNSTATALSYRGRKEKIPDGYKREEISESRKLDAPFKQRIILLDSEDCRTGAMIVPEYTVNPAKYNLLFTGDEFVTEYATSLPITNYSNCGYFLNDSNRHFYISEYRDYALNKNKNYVKLLGVQDGVAAMGIDSSIFRSKAGDSALANKFEQPKIAYKDSTLNSHSDLVRGVFGPYVAMTGFLGHPATTLNIKIPGYSEGKLLEYINIRMADHSEYSAISDRIDISDCKNPEKRVKLEEDKPYHFLIDCYRGDCYICLFTLRINRNHNDKSAPYNETFVDPNTWRQYDIDNPESLEKINIGDVNAVELGMWVTFKVRSNYNLNIRTIDDSNIAENLECGHPRGYYPFHPMSTDGSFKIPEAQVYNLGFSKSLSERYNFEVPNVPYIKNWFGTRIMYSDINITDGYKNGYRTFRGTAYRDYTREYGSIVKIVEFLGNLIVVFEHGIGFLEVNEKAVAAQSLSGNIYITSNNVLPEKLTILSDAIGSQWADSILKVPVKLGSASSVIFGVDTVAKKIWMCDGRNVTCISDFKVLEFLNNNITLGERDLNPVLGVRNVKTLYNAFKLDVMFTFYDCLDGFEDKAWNLCYNLTLQKFITFYSWIPMYMNNIDNIPFSFDRDITKNLGKLGISKANNDFSDGIVLSRNIIENDLSDYYGELSLSNRILPFSDNKTNVKYKIEYEVVRDPYRNDLIFTTELRVNEKGESAWFLVFNKNLGQILTYNDKNNDGKISKNNGEVNMQRTKAQESSQKFYIKGIPESERFLPIDISSELYYRNIDGHAYSDWLESSNIPEYFSSKNPDISAWHHRKTNESVDDYYSRMASIFKKSIDNNYPIYKDRSGRKIMLPEEDRINQDLLIRLVNIRANIKVSFKNESKTLFDIYKASLGDSPEEKDKSETPWINCGYYESAVAVTTKWNLLFLTSDFWKHGLAGLIDISENIRPTVWYGKQHPFEFECIVVNDPSIHKIFLNLELVANKAKPESFHFEIIGDAYDFAKDKPTMYFRQEARKALLQYNGCNISYNKNFLKILPRLLAKSAELIHNYYERLDKLLEISDTYIMSNDTSDYYNTWALITPSVDYRHLSGAEIVYYPNRDEFRIWQHLPAIDINELPLDSASSIIRGNCQYLEDRWKISINPLLICYKNEYSRKPGSTILCAPNNSTWANAMTASLSKSNTKLPPITIKNTCLPKAIKEKGSLDFPGVPANDLLNSTVGKENALYHLYYTNEGFPIDASNWLSSLEIYKTNFGTALNRKETDLRDKFMKVRIRYSGEELAIIDFLNTVYTISYA